MRRSLFAVVSVLSLCIAAVAQERIPNPGKQGTLRTWPATGVWQVALVRLVDGGLGCLLATGHADQNSGERYFWGIRWRGESVAASITDNNQQAVAGPSIQIIIDTIPIGTYQISRRINFGNGFQGVAAEFPQSDKDRIFSLISVGGSMQFITSSSTYSASLQGAQHGIGNLRACILEANHLNAARPNLNQRGKSMD
jgi:hypothetical protein